MTAEYIAEQILYQNKEFVWSNYPVIKVSGYTITKIHTSGKIYYSKSDMLIMWYVHGTLAFIGPDLMMCLIAEALEGYNKGIFNKIHLRNRKVK